MNAGRCKNGYGLEQSLFLCSEPRAAARRLCRARANFPVPAGARQQEDRDTKSEAALKQPFSRLTVLIVSAQVFVSGCAGPQPLSLAIDLQDRNQYVEALNNTNGDARMAFANWMASERKSTPDDVLQADSRFSATHNPFDAHRDRQAVSRGAVIYQIHCLRCHGSDARGHGPATLPDHPATDFKTFGKRFAATLHRGAPRKWFRVIHGGSGEVVNYPDQRSQAMPAFGNQLTREQIWLVITYLQSLDIHAPRTKPEQLH